jgi:hypothetical protein
MAVSGRNIPWKTSPGFKTGSFSTWHFPVPVSRKLPLDESEMHRQDYGDYVIGFDRQSHVGQRLKPLRYVTEQDRAIPLLTPQQCRALTRCSEVDTTGGLIHYPPTKLNREDLEGVWDILPYLKENLGFTFQRMREARGDRTHRPHGKELADEHEWRYIPEKHRDDLFSVVDYDTRTMKALEKLSDATHDSHLIFDHAEVSIIIVCTDAERQQLAATYPKLGSKIRIWDELPKARSH